MKHLIDSLRESVSNLIHSPMTLLFLVIGGLILLVSAIELRRNDAMRKTGRRGRCRSRKSYAKLAEKRESAAREREKLFLACDHLSPDSRLKCGKTVGHVGWHHCGGSNWFGNAWSVEEFADTEECPAADPQDDNMCAASWGSAAKRPHGAGGRTPLTDRIFVGTWTSPLMGGCEITETLRHRIEWQEAA
jgi:hypothetical protein